MLGLLTLFAVAAALVVVAVTAAMLRVSLRPHGHGVAWCLARGLPTSPEELGTTGEERVLELTRGDRTTAFALDGRDPAGPCVVFVPGHSATRYSTLNHLAPLLDHASRVVSFDLPGHGDCTAKTCTLGVREPADVARVLEQVDDGATPIVLFGSSMGAQVSVAAAVREDVTPRLASLVLLGAYRRFGEAMPGHLNRRGVPALPFRFLGETAGRLIAGWARTGFDRADDARRLRCPVLLMHGEHDDLCPLASAQAIRDAAEAAGNDAELVVFPDGGHTTLHTTHPELYEQALSDFLGRFRRQHTPEPSNANESISDPSQFDGSVPDHERASH